MASGLPDYSRVTRPIYGHARGRTLSKPCGMNTYTELMRTPGKGMIYGGAVWLDHTSSQRDGVVWVLIDDSVITWISFLRLNDYAMGNKGFYVLSLNRYDDDNHVYSVGIRYGLTFEKSIALAYDENNGGEPTVHYSLIYALML